MKLALGISIIIFGGLALVVVGGTCPKSWIASPDNADKCYLLEEGKRTEGDARITCGELGGHLASIESQAQQDLLAKMLKDSRIDFDVLTGGTVTPPGKTWRWEDEAPFNYTNFELGQKLNEDRANRIFITANKSNGSRKWIASHTPVPVPYVCSLRLQPRETNNHGRRVCCCCWGWLLTLLVLLIFRKIFGN